MLSKIMETRHRAEETAKFEEIKDLFLQNAALATCLKQLIVTMRLDLESLSGDRAVSFLRVITQCEAAVALYESRNQCN